MLFCVSVSVGNLSVVAAMGRERELSGKKRRNDEQYENIMNKKILDRKRYN
jgi:hypothetical protein